MATKSLETREFNPARDVPAMSDTFLRQHGLNGRGSLPFYRDLARLLGPGSTRLCFAAWTGLADALVRLRGDDRGLRQKNRLDDKLAQLRKQGLICGRGYDLEFLPPDEWRPRVVVDREPELRCVASLEHQASLFGTPEDATFRVFVGDEFPPARAAKTESGSGFQESGFSAKPDPDSVLPVEPYTSYPRSRAVDDDVVVVDEVDDDESKLIFKDEDFQKAALPVTQDEFRAAADYVGRIETRWRRLGLPIAEGSQAVTDRSMFRRSHVLVQRGILPERYLSEAFEVPLAYLGSGRVPKKPASLVTGSLFAIKGFGGVLGKVREQPEMAMRRTEKPTVEQMRAQASQDPIDMKTLAAEAGIVFRPRVEPKPGG